MKNLKYIALMVAMSCGNSDLQATRDKLDNAVREGRIVELREMLKDSPDLNGTDYKQDYNAIHAATKYDQLEALQYLLKAGADPNVNGSSDTSANHLSVMFGNIECMELLIKYGANVNAADSAGDTLLHYAAKYGRRDIARSLLRTRGIDSSLKNKDGKTALDIAKEENKKEIERLF